MSADLPKVLNVAEKNDAAKELSKILSGGRFQRREGFSKYNKIYEFNQHILGKECKMVMTSVSGHLMTLDFAPIYRNWKNCAPVKLFDADIQKTVQDDFVPIKRTLHREIKGCQDLILWTDGDREGEDIAQEIVDVCFEVRKRLRVHRARFSEITPQSVSRACAQLTSIDSQMVDAVEARQELDLRIGCAFTRFQTMRLRNVFPQVLSDQLISYGPCQFPTLGFVVDRYKEIQAFVPETFYKIKVTHEVQDNKVDFNWKRVRLFNHTCCLILYQICMENTLAHVINIQSKPKSKWRPLPLDTVELEKLCSRKLRINAKETMRIAEKLYTQGYISYPRTETNIFPPSFNLPSIISGQTQDPNWGGFAAQLMSVGPTPRQGSKSDNAHPPIHPVKYTNTLTGNEQRIYEFVVRHFLACCSQNAEGYETTVEIEISGEIFTATGLMITARNYLDVYPYDRWSDKTLPHYQMNQTFEPSSIEMVEGETNPPSLLQEADLIGLMEKHGIGTDATHSEHIETIKTRKYVGVQPDGSFVPGELGIGLVEGYDSMGYHLSKPKLRAELESDLKRICDGQCTKESVIQETLAKYKSVFIQATTQATKLDEALSQYFGAPQEFNEQETERPLLSDSVRKCPYCLQADLVVKRKKDGGFMLSCLRFPLCRAVQHFPLSVIDAIPHTELCSQCLPSPVHRLKLKFRPGSVPPYMETNYTGCTTCDDTLINLGFRPIKESTAVANTSNASTRGRGQATRGRGSTRGSGRTGHGGGSGGGGDDGWGRGPPPGGAGFQPQFPPNHFSPPAPISRVGIVGGGAGGVVCNCGIEAILLTVRNEGVNRGRQFYKCPKRDNEGRCTFFLWADEGTNETGAGPANSSYDGGRGNYSPGYRGGYGRGSYTPGYGPGDNYTTGYGRGSPGNRGGGYGRGGNYGGENNGPGFLYTQQNKRGRGRGKGTSRNSSSCQCGLSVVQKTVQKGPNEGRLFYTCSKPRDQQCGYFEWADGKGKGRARSSSAVNGPNDGGPATKKRAPPTCSICHIPGHTKRSCPNN